MDKFVTLFLSGAVSGGLYAILAIGLVLSYTTTRIFNLGHGATAFASAYVYYQFNTGLGWSVAASFVLAVCVFAPLTGLVWDRLVFRRLAEANETVRIVASVGVLIVMPALVQWLAEVLRGTFGVGFVDTRSAFSIPGIGPYPQTTWTLTDGVTVNSDQLIVLGACVVSFVALWSVLRFSTLGLRLRASVDSPTVARLRGVDTERMSTIAWTSSFALAGLAGVLAAPFVGPFGLVADNYTYALFVAATAAVIAGLRSVPIAFVAAILLGAGRNLAEGYVTGQYLGGFGRWIDGVQGLRSSLPYVALFVALVMMGHERGRRAAGLSSIKGQVTIGMSHLSAKPRLIPWFIAALGLSLYSLVLADSIWLHIVLVGLATSIVFLSFTVLTGYGGMVSLAQSTFVAIGALVSGRLIGDGWPFGAAAVAGVLSAGVLGVLVAIPALRLGGLPLTLATLALALLGSSVLFNIDGLANGVEGWSIERPVVGPFDLSDDRTLFVALLLVVGATVWMVSNLARSASGRAILALRASAPGATSSGVSPFSTKVTVFAASSMLAGLGGVLLATIEGSIRGTTYPPIIGFLWLAVVATIGIGRPAAAILGGLVISAIPRVLTDGIHLGGVGWDGTTSSLIPQILFGLGAIGLARNPEGLLASNQVSPAAALDSLRSRGWRPRRRARSSAAMPNERRVGADDADVLLELSDVRAAYEGVEVLHGIDLTVRRGEIHALIGANGAGKSTMCAVAAGLLHPTHGFVRFDGLDLTEVAPHRRVDHGIVLIPEARGILPGLSVRENLRLWLPDRTDHDQVYDAFPNLADRRDLVAANLSGGEQQMLSLAPLIVRPPRLLIADEPTLGLAQPIVVQVNALFSQLQASGTTLLLVEEKARDAMVLADRVTALALGERQWTRDVSEVSEALLAETYLSAPSPAQPTPAT